MHFKRTWCLSVILSLTLMAWFPIFTTEVAAQNVEFPQNEVPLIAPPDETKPLKEAKIDNEYFEVMPFFGIYSVEGFSGSEVYGLRAAIHMTEDVFLEGHYGLTSVSFDNGTGLALFNDTNVRYWNVNLGYNLFPGQIFLTRTRTLNSTIYFVGGVGQTKFDAQNRFTYNIGTGYKIFITDWIDVGFRITIHSFESDLLGKKEKLRNTEGTFSVGFFF